MKFINDISREFTSSQYYELQTHYSMLTSLHLFVYFSLFNYGFSNAISLRTADLRLEDLIYVQAIWRHGDRAPHQLPYPTDLNDQSFWPRGWSQLTNIGMKQLYDLGFFFRKRYNAYVGEFTPANVRIVTSRSDRAIVSAQAMLRGLFPAENPLTQWLKGEQWQPIPFHTESIERNAPLLHPTLYRCSHYDKLVKNETAVIVDAMMSKYVEVAQFLANVTGIGEGLNFGRIAALFDIQREPAWVYQKWPQLKNMSTIDIITEFKRVSQISKYDTLEKARFKGGLLLGDMLHRFQNVSDGIGVEARKMFLYSAHDATILSLQHALNVGNGLLVPYSACLIMELYRAEGNKTVVKILYKNETENADAYELFVPGCSVPCTLDQLIRLSAPVILNKLDDLNEICEDSESSINGNIFSNDANQHATVIPIVFMLLHLLTKNC
ncbi:histidine acid phosphatase [Onchocerca flexuosa]|uniref:Histidine acid phosphatase n=1 Tax=Onchocerca flexuosa TaxID=387005 RepID=A0A238BZ19_9BILA|nr:histidine acid phosphatase [Onchocerca flexuosa]